MGGKWRLVGLILIAGLLAGCNAPQTVTVSTVPGGAQTVCRPDLRMSFPCSAPESDLILESLRSYCGPNWEDGSGQYVENVAGLMIANPTDRMVEFVSFAIEQRGQTLYFFAYALPPHSRCLVLEYTGKTCAGEAADSCRQLCAWWDYQELSREQIDYLGLGTSMTVINRSGYAIGDVTVCYKQYVKDGDYYLGGSVQRAYLHSLEPEERRTVYPMHYDAAHARIVEIELNM